MNIAIIGAGGAVGRQIAQMIVSERIIERDQRLLLVGNAQGESAKSLPGFAVDLRDAYAEICPQIDTVFTPEEVRGDLIVMAAGDTISAGRENIAIDRDALAKKNLPVFERYAAALSGAGQGSEIVICVSNPNELAVACFAKYLGRQRVIGMGSFLDSWRFRKEIARDLGIHRQKIHGFMCGEHGANMIPLWSSVHVFGYSEKELRIALERIRKGVTTPAFSEECGKVRHKLTALLRQNNISGAYSFIAGFPPDIRTVFTPLITQLSGAKTVIGTARATLSLLQMIALGNDALVTGQIKIEGEFHGIHSTLGVPFVIGNKGVDRIIEVRIADDEKQLLTQAAENVNQKLKAWM